MSRSRPRPAAWSPGVIAVAASWIAAGAIARLTGAPAVIALMVAVSVGAAVDAITGWLAARQPTVHGVVGPDVVDVDAEEPVVIDLEVPTSRRVRRLVVVDPWTGDAVGSGNDRVGGRTTIDSIVITCRFERAGIHDTLRVDIEAVGALGLLWWRRSHTVSLSRPIRVAPLAAGPPLDVERTPAMLDGPAETRRGVHHGDVDGVRPWRDGEPAVAVHWPTSLRSGNLVVHDRSASSEQRWTVDVSALPDRAGARVRATIDEGLRGGHRVTVRDASGTSHDVLTDDEAARWAAEVEAAHDAASRAAGADLLPFWRRPLGVRRRAVESDSDMPGRARWSAAAAAFCALATLVGGLTWSNTLVLALGAAIAGGAAISSQIARRAGRRPRLLQVAIVITIIGALIAIVLDARDVDGLVAALRGPMPNLLMLLVVLHGFEVVDRRTLRVHQAIALVVAAYAAGLRIDDALGWWLGAFAITFFASLWLTPSRRPARHPRATVGSTFRPVAWVAASIVATIAVSSVVPIPDGPASLGLPALSNEAPAAATPGALVGPDGTPASQDASSTPERDAVGDVVGYPGFTERLDTSVRGELGNQVVMRVRSPEPAFWRGQTFSEFDGRTWRVAPEVGVRHDGPVIDVAPTLGDTDGRYAPTEELIQTYYVETDLPNLVYAAQRPTRVIFDGSLWTRPDGALRSDVTLTSGSVYTVVSERVRVTPSVLRAQGDLGELFAGFREIGGGSLIDPFLELPASTTRRTVDLATRLRTPGESTYDTIRAYEAWLAANTEYDLDAPVPADGHDAVDDFLFESRRGFCEQIASTLAIMLRSQGVPARLATGYVSGERDRVSGVWKVRASDAHAWVEVWFPQTGWQAFDPTADVPLAGEVERGTVGGDLVAAATAWTAEHRLQAAGVALAAALAWVMVLVLRSMRRRRDRGRWGLLQDRFATLADALVEPPEPTDEPTGAAPVAPPTNPTIAARLRARGTGPDPEPVARALDRAAFDPTWLDDDGLYEHTRAAIVELERAAR